MLMNFKCARTMLANPEVANSIRTFDSIRPKQVENTEYTDYFCQHYAELADFADRLPNIDHSLVGDLLNDVWISLRSREMAGKGFDNEYVARSGNINPVDVAIKNTIAAYGKNTRYTLKYNNKVAMNGGTAVMISISEAINGDFDDDSAVSQSIHQAFREASIICSKNVEDVVDELEHDNMVREALAYALISTEDYSVNLSSILGNLEEMTSILEGRGTYESPDPDFMVRSMHNSMFREYELDKTGNKGYDKELAESFRIIFTEFANDKDNLFRLVDEVKQSIA